MVPLPEKTDLRLSKLHLKATETQLPKLHRDVPLRSLLQCFTHVLNSVDSVRLSGDCLVKRGHPPAQRPENRSLGSQHKNLQSGFRIIIEIVIPGSKNVTF